MFTMAKKTGKVQTGISLEADVAEYLEQLGQRDDRDRSWLINSIVRQHAEHNGAVIGKASRQSSKPPKKK